MVTLGVADLGRARRFYTDLGWEPAPSPGDIVFFQAAGIVVGLWDRGLLAADSGVTDAGGWGGITMAHNVSDPGEVDRLMDDAERAGATVVRPPAETEWGGYSGVFLDPDGHAWEIAHNPYWELGEDGSTRLGG